MDIKKIGQTVVKHYLRIIVGILLRLKRPEIIAVTGTAGKTTTKETIYAVLQQKFGKNVARSHGSLSTKTGLPIALLEFKPNWSNLGPPWWHWPGWLVTATLKTLIYLFNFKPYPKIWVVEFAADLPGDFDFLLSYIKPSIAVVTNVGIGHTQFFNNPQGVAKEKSSLVLALPDDGVAILNYNDELTRGMAQKTKAKILWVRSKGLSFAPSAARIIGRIYNMSYQEIEKGLQKVKLPAGRLDVFKTKSGLTIIDSSYNANPVSMAAALEFLADYPRKSLRESRKIAVLGEMLELGHHSPAAHKEIYQKSRLVADEVISIGSGFKNFSKNYFPSVEKATPSLLSYFKPSDIILIKGSHGVRLNRLVDKFRT